MTTELHEAVREGDIAWVRDVLRRDPTRVNDRNDNYETPLHVVYNICGLLTRADDRLLIIQALLDYGADVNAQDESPSNRTPLFKAIMRAQTKGVRLLLENGADPNLRMSDGLTPLHCASSWGNDKIVNLLLQYGANVNAVDAKNLTPLDTALHSIESSSKAHILLGVGAKIRDIYYTAYQVESYEILKDTLWFLIKYGAEIDLSSRFSLSSLYYTCKNSDSDKFAYLNEILSEQGVDIDVTIREGEKRTELHDALTVLNETRIRHLLEAGADVNAKTVLDETPLYTLIDYNGDEYIIARLLIEAGADLHARSLIGFTPFQLAVGRNCSKIVNFMLAKIAGVEENTLKNELDSSMWPKHFFVYFQTVTPLDVAIVLGYEEVVDKLIKMGHHMETSNYHLPLFHAVRKRNYEITKMLLEVGCGIDGYYSHAIPSIDMTKCNTQDLEFVSLLWEFDCISIFRKLLLGAFRHIINQPNANNLTCLLVFYYKIGLRSNKLSEDFISMTGVLRSNKNLLSILALCDDQLDELKKAEVCNNKSKLDLLTMKMDSLVKFLNDDNNFKVCKELRESFDDDQELEVHECAIKVRMDLAMEKRILLDSAKDVLNKALQDVLHVIQLETLPEEIMFNILDYLNIRELKKMSVEI